LLYVEGAMLNYHHLHYFAAVTRTGSVVRAARELGVSQPTISAQLRLLEEALGEKLFTRRGRDLALTEIGQLVQRYAEEIFHLGRELEYAVQGRPSSGPHRFTVGVSDSLPKLTTLRLLRPALEAGAAFRLVLRVDKTSRLIADLGGLALDLVLADEPVTPALKVRAFNHLLGESAVTVFGTAGLTARYRRGFPRSLDDAPFVLQTENTALRRSLDQWFNAARIRPRIIAEAEDMAMLQTLGQQGLGLFAAPSVAAEAIKTQHEVGVLGELPAVKERFFAITVERRLRHPAAVAISTAARSEIFV
jgi:LysR family transcriptional regulator, transcriptional activator of nhaA